MTEAELTRIEPAINRADGSSDKTVLKSVAEVLDNFITKYDWAGTLLA